MGVALAEVAAEMGMNVTLVTGPVNIHPNNKSIVTFKVVTADEMAEKCIALFPQNDIAVLAAAVADFKVENPGREKIKKTGDAMLLNLVPTVDIAFELGKMKRDNQFLAGFALETNNETANAISKLDRKNLDMIVLNSLHEKGAGFETDTNRISIIDKSKNIIKFGLKSKREAAYDILEKIASFY